MSAESVHEQMRRWNPAPVDHAIEHLIGHAKQIEDEADEVSDESEYEGLTVAVLKEEIDRRNADRDPEGDNYLSNKGRHAELVARLEDDDEDEEDYREGEEDADDDV